MLDVVYITSAWTDISQFFNDHAIKSEVKSLSRVQVFATPWTVAYQAPQSMEFSRQIYWSGLPFPTAGDLPSSGVEPAYPVSPALADRFFTTVPPGKNLHLA